MTTPQIQKIREVCEKMIEASEKATPAPWVWADVTIFDSDREAQKRGEPFWTLVETEYNRALYQGKLGDKLKGYSEREIARAEGYEADGIGIKEPDAEFITLAANHSSQLAKSLLIAINYLNNIESVGAHTTAGLAHIALEQITSQLMGEE